MSASVVDPVGTRRVRPAHDGRPPCHTWPHTPPASTNQPTLALDLVNDPTQPFGTRVPAHSVQQPWSAVPAERLPDARAWSISLAQALIEALQGHRPIPQLTRWVDDRVLAAVTVHRRMKGAAVGPGRASARPILRSVRIQYPQPEVAEVAAHLTIGRRSIAMAFRLEARFDRWLCTALELGPSHRGVE
jgi:hypothetical protein